MPVFLRIPLVAVDRLEMIPRVALPGAGNSIASVFLGWVVRWGGLLAQPRQFLFANARGSAQDLTRPVKIPGLYIDVLATGHSPFGPADAPLNYGMNTRLNEQLGYEIRLGPVRGRRSDLQRTLMLGAVLGHQHGA
jgi:hypothetical protein